jgi:hypothetical protein
MQMLLRWSEELVKVLRHWKLIGQWIKIRNCKRQYSLYLRAADSVLHDLLIAVILVALVMLFSCTVYVTH